MALAYIATGVAEAHTADWHKVQSPLHRGQPIQLVRSWNHRFNPSAIEVWLPQKRGQVFLGYLPPRVADVLVEDIERGCKITGEVFQCNQGMDQKLPTITLKLGIEI